MLVLFGANAQTPFQRVYTTLNTKCNNAACHANGCVDFNLSSPNLHTALFNVNAANASSIAKLEKLVKPQHPYFSFLLRKIAGATFDTDLSIDASEGALMNDINGQQLSKKKLNSFANG